MFSLKNGKLGIKVCNKRRGGKEVQLLLRRKRTAAGGCSENNLSRGRREGRASSVFSIKESTAAAAEWRYGAAAAAVEENRFCGTGRRHQLAGGCEGGRVYQLIQELLLSDF